jgi:hypothetical protein
MADVFISYKSGRRALVAHLAEILAANGFSVWWDRDLIAGRSFDIALERELRHAKAVIVLWCSGAITSEWVREEATLGAKLQKVLPVWLEKVELPLGFSRLHTLDLTPWDGDPIGAALEPLLLQIEQIVGRSRTCDQQRLIQNHSRWTAAGRTSPTRLPIVDLPEPTKRPDFRESDESDVKALDRINAKRAERIGSGHRIIFGVAGSGKTVLLVARAQALAADPAKRVLVLCFNTALARFLQLTINSPNATVLNFHAWGIGQCGAQMSRDNDEFGRRVLQGVGRIQKYDAVLIDEGQDFRETWFKAAKAALKDPDNGDLLIAYDAAQSVYGQRGFSWASVGVNARGRSYSKDLGLHLNYRNTREILAAAAPFSGASFDDAEEPSEAVQADPLLATRQGPRPLLLARTTRVIECQAVEELVADLVQKGVNPSDIAIIYPRLPQALSNVRYRMLQELRHIAPVVEIAPGAPYDIGQMGVRFLNSFQAKGLQFRHVIFMWADLLPWEDAETDKKLMYVSMTRAEETLAISYKSGGNPNLEFIETLRPHCAIST